MTTGCPYTHLPIVWFCVFSLPLASKIKPGCTMNIMSLLLLVFNFQTVGGKCTDNKCSLHARSLPVLSSVSWNGGHINLSEAFEAQNKHIVQLSLQAKESRSFWPQLRVCIVLIASAKAKGRCCVELLGQHYVAHSDWEKKGSSGVFGGTSLCVPVSSSSVDLTVVVIFFSKKVSLFRCYNTDSGRTFLFGIGGKTETLGGKAETRKVFLRQIQVIVRSERFQRLDFF